MPGGPTVITVRTCSHSSSFQHFYCFSKLSLDLQVSETASRVASWHKQTVVLKCSRTITAGMASQKPANDGSAMDPLFRDVKQVPETMTNVARKRFGPQAAAFYYNIACVCLCIRMAHVYIEIHTYI